MPLEYTIISTFRPGEVNEGSKLWFPELTGSSQINLREIAEILLAQ